jgi:ATP-dependent DNA helicase PIF1
MKVITTAVRAQGDIVLCSAMTGLAALNHEGGTMAHATYKIPVTGSEEIPQCSVTARSERAELLRAAALHIWDEFPAIHQKNFEAVSNCLCDVNGSSASGLVFVCCGNFRQIPPEGDLPSFTVEASIPSSPLWSSFARRNLTHPQ